MKIRTTFEVTTFQRQAVSFQFGYEHVATHDEMKSYLEEEGYGGLDELEAAYQQHLGHQRGGVDYIGEG